MASHSEIRAAILKVAGNPDSGVIKDLADDMARAVVALDSVVEEAPAKEIRVVRAKETR